MIKHADFYSLQSSAIKTRPWIFSKKKFNVYIYVIGSL